MNGTAELMFVYTIRACDSEALVKIGISHNPVERIKTLQTGYPYRLELQRIYPCTEAKARHIEKEIHMELSFRRLNCGGTEWFKRSAVRCMRRWAEPNHQRAHLHEVSREFMICSYSGTHEQVTKEVLDILAGVPYKDILLRKPTIVRRAERVLRRK